MPNEATAIGIHIYSGAFTIGVETHFKILGQWEEGPWGADTFNLNRPHIPHPLTKAEWPVAQHVGKVNLVYTNPPCACWSAVGSHLGTGDPRFQFTLTAAQTAMALKPDFFILESVPMAWTKGQSAYESIAANFRKIGYGTTILLTNGILHGGTQSRPRFHLIAHRYEIDFPAPEVTWQMVPTVGELIGDIAKLAVMPGETPKVPNHVTRPLGPSHQMVLEELKQGEKWNVAAQRLRDLGRDAKNGRLFACRLNEDSTCNTVLDLNALAHPTEPRTLTLREGARLCGYPDNFIFAVTDKHGIGTKSDVTQAVLPPMGRYLAERVRVAMENSYAKPDGLPIIDFRKLASGLSRRAYLKTRDAFLHGA